MIDVVREVSAFKPIDLTRIPEIYKPATEQMRNAFILYNKALHEVQLGHEDIAKNYLRKAVTIFPDFYDAVMVLGILVFANGDRIGAVRIFNSVKDVELRSVSIGLLDHLVEEAERPSSVRNSNKNKNIDSQGNKKLANVMSGGERNANSIPHREAKYSRGQIFERSNGYYEPQPKRSREAELNKNYVGYNKATIKKENSENVVPQQPKTQNVHPRQPEEATAFKNQAKDIHDVRLLNKYLLIIVGILLVFAIVISTLLINKTADVRRLEDKLNKNSFTSFSDSFAESEEEQNEKFKDI